MCFYRERSVRFIQFSPRVGPRWPRLVLLCFPFLFCCTTFCITFYPIYVCLLLCFVFVLFVSFAICCVVVFSILLPSTEFCFRVFATLSAGHFRFPFSHRSCTLLERKLMCCGLGEFWEMGVKNMPVHSCS